MMTWTDEQIDTWCLSFRSYREDISAVTKARDLQQQRGQVRQDILRNLATFLNGRETLQGFLETLQQPAHADWNRFGIHGLSGSTFLKKLTKKCLQQEQLAQHLRSALLLPRGGSDGQQKMQTFSLFLEELIATGQMSRASLQPDRVPFFLSVWWSIQDGEMWPRFIGDLRQRLLHELPLVSPVGDQIGLYFAFRERFQALKAAFGIASWELEHFLLWQTQQEHEKAKALAPTVQQSKPLPTLNEVSRRLRLLWFLAQVGHKVGCQVWITRQDQEKSWQEDVLGHLSVPALPSSGVLHDETLLEDIAVLWMLKEEIVAAYEIITTDENLIPSLMHLYDLSLVQARRRTRCCLVLPGQYVEQALQALARPLFRQQQGRHQCALIREEDLTQHGEHILRWANSPGVIEDMIAFSLEAWNEYIARGEGPTGCATSFYLSKKRARLAKDQKNVTPWKEMLLRVIF